MDRFAALSVEIIVSSQESGPESGAAAWNPYSKMWAAWWPLPFRRVTFRIVAAKRAGYAAPPGPSSRPRRADEANRL